LGLFFLRHYLGRIDGKDSYKSFRTLIDAESWAQGERERRRTQGIEASRVGSGDVLRWEAINKELLELGSSLAKQGEMAVESLKRISKTGTLGELKVAFFADTKSDLQPRSEDSLRSRINVFCKYLGGEQKDAQKATPEAVLAFLRSRKTSQRDRTNYRLGRSRWLGWAAAHGWLPANPIPVAKKTAVKKKRNRGEAVTLSPGQARDLLRAVIESGDLQVGAYVALSLFAGIRPEEFRGRARVNGAVVTTTTNWEDLAERTVTIKPECAKTRMGRESESHGTLDAWLDWIHAKAPVDSLRGPIVSGAWTPRWKTWRKLHSEGLLENLRGQGKGISPGTGVDRRDILRHSYGSYRLAQGAFSFPLIC